MACRAHTAKGLRLVWLASHPFPHCFSTLLAQLTMSRLEVEVPMPPDQLFELLAHTHVRGSSGSACFLAGETLLPVAGA